jgi:hypothetical protein
MVGKILAVRMLGNRDMLVSSVGTRVSRMLGINAIAVNQKNNMPCFLLRKFRGRKIDFRMPLRRWYPLCTETVVV